MNFIIITLTLLFLNDFKDFNKLNNKLRFLIVDLIVLIIKSYNFCEIIY